MRLATDLRVAAPPEQAWTLLGDLPRVAGALPGAAVEPQPVDGAHRGAVVGWEGLVELQDADEDGRVVRYYARGRERGGSGTAAATVTVRAEPAGDGSRLLVELELAATGGGPSEPDAVLAAVASALEDALAERPQRGFLAWVLRRR